MKDILTDIVAHTHSLGNIPLVKIKGSDAETLIESMAEDRSVIINAKTKTPVTEFEGIFGMPNLDKLNLHLKNPEYKENAKIEVIRADRNGEEIPVNLHFENSTGDFVNDYRFMNQQIVNEKLKSVQFKGAQWDIEFEPSMASIARLKLQAAAHLIGFSTRSQREEVERLAAKARFYRTLNAKLQAEIERARAEMERLDPPQQPVYTEKPIDETLQTGESKLLGGEMRLTAPWAVKSED